MFEDLNQKFKAFQFNRGLQQSFLEDITALVQDGVPASQAVQTVAQIAKGTMKEVAEDILARIAEGGYLADGMRKWFPPSIVAIVRAGEEGGTLAENMASAAKALGAQKRGIASLVNSLVYPITVIIMGMGVAIFIKHSVFLNFIAIKPLATWPAVGKSFYKIATFVEHWWWLILIALVAFIVMLGQLLREMTGDARVIIDSIPIFSLYRDQTASRFMETLGMLLSNGIVLKQAFTILKRQANHYLAWHIYKMEFRLSGGRENIADVLDTGLIPQSDILRLKVIARGKGFEHALVRLGQLSSDRTQNKIETTGKILGITLLVVGALWAAFMIFAIYTVGSFVAT